MDGLIEIAKQVPALGVLAWIVYKFLGHLHKRDSILKDISNQCHQVQGCATEAVNKNSEILGKVLMALDKLNGTH